MLNSTLVHQANPGRRLRGSAALAWLAAITILCGCRTLPPMPAMDLSDPGWKVSEGSALWRSGDDAPEIAGEILLALHPDGRGFVQFTKSPLPFVVAQLDGERWRVEFIPENRSFAGRGQPPRRIVWLQFLRLAQGASALEGWEFMHAEEGHWTLRSLRGKETLEISVTPTRQPKARISQSLNLPPTP